MLTKLTPCARTVNIDTGNILNVKEIKQLTGSNQTDELIESLKITLSNFEPSSDLKATEVCITRGIDTTDGQVERDSLKISVKIFIMSSKPGVLSEALNKVLDSLSITRVDSLVLACKLEPSAVLSALQNIWAEVEDYVTKGSVTDVGVSDVDTDVFVALYQWAKIKPRIIQINLTVCCVVPPILQEFCKNNNVQLLTHSDSVDILPKPALYQVMAATDADNLALDWVVRYLTHIQSRGVLHSKGYLVSVSRSTE